MQYHTHLKKNLCFIEKVLFFFSLKTVILKRGFLSLFMNLSNLAMADVDETYSRPRNRKPEYDNGKKIPVKNQDKDIGNSNF